MLGTLECGRETHVLHRRFMGRMSLITPMIHNSQDTCGRSKTRPKNLFDTKNASQPGAPLRSTAWSFVAFDAQAFFCFHLSEKRRQECVPLYPSLCGCRTPPFCVEIVRQLRPSCVWFTQRVQRCYADFMILFALRQLRVRAMKRPLSLFLLLSFS